MMIKFVSKNGITVIIRIEGLEADILMAMFDKIPDSEFISRPYMTMHTHG